MDIPFGFHLDPQSGLYFKEENGWDGGSPVRIVTWFDPQSGTTQQTNYPATLPMAESGPDFVLPTEPPPFEESEPDFDLPTEPPPFEESEPDFDLPTEPPPFEESEPDFDLPTEPPPFEESEPFLNSPPIANTNLPECTPYETVPLFSPEPPSMLSASPLTITQDVYTGDGIPQPLLQKKKKSPMIALIAGVIVVLAAIGICAWQFEWFGGKSTPASMPASSAPSSAPSSVPTPEVSSDASSESELSEQGSRIEKPELTEDIGVEVNYQSATTADITLTNVTLLDSYPTKIPGVAAEPNEILYAWVVTVNECALFLTYIREDASENRVITMSDMYAFAQNQREGSSDDLISIEHSVTDNSITFHDITVAEDLGIDFSSSETVYTIEVLEGLNFGEKQVQAHVTKSEASSLSEERLATQYHYVDADTGMQVVLNLELNENTFKLDADLGGSTYYASGGFAVQRDGSLVLESADTFPAWQGGARFSIQADGGLQLESPEHLGVLPAGGVLAVASPNAAKKTENDAMNGAANGAANGESFLYAGVYACADTRIPAEYCPKIQLNKDMSFTMEINTGNGMVSGSGTFVWDMQPGMIYLNFKEINGVDPGKEYTEMQVKTVSENKIQFLTQGLGLMGYEEQQGIFIKQ